MGTTALAPAPAAQVVRRGVLPRIYPLELGPGAFVVAKGTALLLDSDKPECGRVPPSPIPRRRYPDAGGVAGKRGAAAELG